jgi:hypothetical protein
MAPSSPYFPESYIESREWFRDQHARVQSFWPTSELRNYALTDYTDLSIDWIAAPCPLPEGEILIISTGLHGAEGFTGTAVLHRFLSMYLDKLDHARTGLLLIHAINPWGMHYRRRTNAQNVDLNRNFRFGPGTQVKILNPGYHSLSNILHPARRLGNYQLETIRYILNSLVNVAFKGLGKVREAVLLGQIDDPQGPYFGGYELQEESRVVWDLLTGVIDAHSQIVHIDIHTGYGARGEMSLVNSVRDEVHPEEWARRFEYPHVVRADPEAFYAMQGDMIDGLYAWGSQNVPQHQYFGTAFEFGTMGDGILAQVRSLRAIIFENQTVHEGLDSVSTAQIVSEEFKQLFDPPSTDWRQSVILRFDQALSGILNEFGYFMVG